MHRSGQLGHFALGAWRLGQFSTRQNTSKLKVKFNMCLPICQNFNVKLKERGREGPRSGSLTCLAAQCASSPSPFIIERLYPSPSAVLIREQINEIGLLESFSYGILPTLSNRTRLMLLSGAGMLPVISMALKKLHSNLIILGRLYSISIWTPSIPGARFFLAS